MTMALRTRPDDELFDESAGYDDDRGVRLAEGLTEQERQQAITLYRLFNELWGFCLVIGDPGTGKDVLGNYLLHCIKRYFPDKRILRDEKPRRLFGEYDGLFNEAVIRDELKKMRDYATGSREERSGEKYDGKYMEALEKAADQWATEEGKVLLQHSAVFMTEFWRYCPRREPHKPMNKAMGGIFKEKRHIDTLIIGTTQLWSELDRKTCLPWVDWLVTCSRSKGDSTRYTYFVQKAAYDRERDRLQTISRAFAIPLDAGKPRSFLGDGKIVVRKPWYKPENDEERLVLSALGAGLSDYEALVAFLEVEAEMSEWETLAVLKELCLKLPGKRPKFVIDYPCYYRIFNSKSAPNMKTSIRTED
jgi:hypothetical protein